MQYAVLWAASWYPNDFRLYNLPLHSSTTATIENMTCVYHGAFMKKYAGMFSHRHVHATIVQFVCRTSHVTIQHIIHLHNRSYCISLIRCCATCFVTVCVIQLLLEDRLYLKAAFVLLRAYNCAATIWGWCLIKEIHYYTPRCNLRWHAPLYF